MFIIKITPLITRDKSDDSTGSLWCSPVVNRRLPEPSDVGSDEPRDPSVKVWRWSTAVSLMGKRQTSILENHIQISSILHSQSSPLLGCLMVASRSVSGLWSDGRGRYILNSGARG
jgi:hypothetical protein